jgi:hypothetical protein
VCEYAAVSGVGPTGALADFLDRYSIVDTTDSAVYHPSAESSSGPIS